MGDGYERLHFVSHEYLSAWQDEERVLSVYKKEDGRLYKKCSAEEFAVENEVRYMSHDELLKVFSCLEGYDVSLENGGQLHELSGIHEYAVNYCDFEKWMIAESGTKYLRKQKFKAQIEKNIAEVMAGYKVKREEKLDYARKNISEYVSGRKKMGESEIKRLKEFMAFQISKRPSEALKLKALLDLGDVSNEYKNIFSLLNPLHVVLVKPVGRSFYTSDNPVMVVADKRFLKGEYNGIYMPLTPKCMAVLYNGSGDTYSITSFESNVVRRLNTRIKENSSMYYFCWRLQKRNKGD